MKRLAIYPGTFNPFTVGHYNILEKAERLFDEVIVAPGINIDKVPNDIIKLKNEELNHRYMSDSKNTVVKFLKKQIPSKKVEGYIGFLTDFIREKMNDYDEVVVIRGLRNGYDYDYEYNAMRHMWDQLPGMSIIMIACDPVFSHVSSSAYRNLEAIKKGSGHHLLAREKQKGYE